MRKIVLLIIMFVMPLMVLGKEYTLDDIGVKITFEDDFYVFTRDNYQNNETLKKLGITEEYMYNFFYNNKAYIDVVPKSFAYDLVINVVLENLDMTNLSNYPDGMINEFSKDVLKTVPDAEYSIYTNGQYKFMRISFFDKTSNMYIYRYYTVFDIKGISFHIQKASAITEEDKQVLDNAIKTVKFDNINHNTKEKDTIQKKIDEYGKSKKWYENVLIDAVIGGVVGGVTAFVLNFKKKKKDESTGV